MKVVILEARIEIEAHSSKFAVSVFSFIVSAVLCCFPVVVILIFHFGTLHADAADAAEQRQRVDSCACANIDAIVTNFTSSIASRRQSQALLYDSEK